MVKVPQGELEGVIEVPQGEAEAVTEVPQGEDEGAVPLGEQQQLKPVAALAEHGISFVSSW